MFTLENLERVREEENALRAEMEKIYRQTLLVDTYHKISAEDLSTIVKPIVELCNPVGTDTVPAVRYITNYVYPGTAAIKFSKALSIIRQDIVAGYVLMIVKADRSYAPEVCNYSERDIDTTVYVASPYRNGGIYHTAEEYLSLYSEQEFTLDNIARQYNSFRSERLESFGELYAQALGLELGVVSNHTLDPNDFDYLKRPHSTIPYAGKEYYNLNISGSKIPYYFNAVEAIGSQEIVLYSRKTISKAKKGTPTSELYDLLEMAQFYADHPELLEDDGYTICECGNPVKIIGDTHEDGFCPFCDRPIKDFKLSNPWAVLK